jgi:hypothetical protein
MTKAKVVRLEELDREPGLETVSALDLQAKEFPAINYAIPGYVAEGVTILGGKPKLGKSWLVLDWATAKAYGGTACGSIECSAGDVLYCALEDNERRLQRRLKQLLPDQAEWPDRLQLTTQIRRLDAGGLDDLRAWVNASENPSLIILDTLACVRPLRRSQENGYEADYAALAPLQLFAGEMGIAIVVVHHLRKMESDDPLDTISGTTGLTVAADSILVLSRDGQGVTLYGRGRDIDEIEAAMSFDRTTGRWSILGPASEVRLSDERAAILAVLSDAPNAMSPTDIAKATGQPNGNVRYLLNKMTSAGEVVKEGRGRYVVP